MCEFVKVARLYGRVWKGSCGKRKVEKVLWGEGGERKKTRLACGSKGKETGTGKRW